MTEKKSPQIGGGDLRSQAEERLRENRGTAKPPRTEDEPLRLHHELQVHQVELEMQNEELRNVRDEKEATLEKYTNFYDFAPVGFFTLDRIANIRSVNLAGASLMGVERSRLVGMRFGLLVADEARPAFADFLGKIFTNQDKKSCEMTLLKEENSRIFVQIEAVAAVSGQECLLALVDITDRKLVDEKVHTIISSIPDLVFARFDHNLSYQYVTPSIEKITGLSHDLYIGKTIRNVGLPEYLVVLWENAINVVFETGQPKQIEFNYSASDGLKYYTSDFTPEHSSNGSIINVICITRDISESKKSEKLLKESEERFRSIVENSPDMAMIHIDGKFVYLNPAAVKNFGISNQQEYIGKPVIEVVHPDFRDLVRKRVTQVTKYYKSNIKVEELLLRKDGSTFWVEISGIPTTYEGKEAAHVFAVNITDRKLNEIDNRRLLLRQRAILDNLPMMAWLKDSESRYEMVNDQLAKASGHSVEECIGKTDLELFPEEMAKGYMADDHKVCITGKKIQVEEQISTQHGTKWHLTYKTPLFDEHGQVVGTTGIAQDISERKRAEEIREATIEILHICNEADSKQEFMQGLALFFQRLAGCEAVGVRLKEGEDFPYYETRGFPEEFVLAENRLCAYDQAGEMVRNSAGHPAYACMCGNIIAGRFDCAKPFFTSHGSFWTGSTTELLVSATDEERQAKTRNRCNDEGYESVALVPLRSQGDTIGLFQFNDRRRGHFTAEKIALLENFVDYVAITLAKLRVDEALLEAGRFSRQIIDSAEEGIIVYGLDMRYQVWNPYMERLTGDKADEVIGRHPLECFPILEETEVIEKIRKVLAGQQLATTEFTVKSDHPGYLNWISDTSVPLRNAKGEIVGVIGTVHDITERKQSEKKLQETTQRLQLATAAGRLGIWDWDIVNDVLVWNERMFELYGVSVNTFRISRETWEKCLHPDDMAMALEETRAALSGEKEYGYEFRVVHTDGETKFIKTNGLIIRDEAGNAIRMIGMNQDITDRKHMEEQLRQAQKMEAIGQLAGGVAHDFNNILTAIYGYCSVLQMKMGKDAPFRHDIDQIYAAAERAANLTRSLLAFSRKQIMNPRKVNLNEIVMNVVKLLTRIIGEDIQLKTVCTGKPLRVFADSGQIEQVLMNMATNARDAMPNGGILTIETGVQEIDESFIHAYGYGEVGNYVVLSVSDTGKGMDAETRKKIFEPFFTTKEVGKGTGLGLSIVYGVIKQHNGYINVYSEPDEGTTFRIYLPQVYEEDADSEKELLPEYPRMGSETVLVAEDDTTIRELAGSILRQFGYDVILAHDGEDAIEKFMAGKEKIAIIVMDMIMPRKSGKEAYEEIRKVRSDVKILFISGYSPDLLHGRGIFAHSEEVLMKPIHPLELVRKVRAVLDLSP